jgi:hypothetical protein
VQTVIAQPGLHPVYNLTVEGCPEYYANGILAHNCDAMRYAVGWIDQFAAGMAALPPTAGLGGGYDHPGTGQPYDDPRGLSVGGDELTLHDYV